MEKIKIYYVKSVDGTTAYTNTNEMEFAKHVNTHLVLGLGKYPTFEGVQEALADTLEVGKKEIEINF